MVEDNPNVLPAAARTRQRDQAASELVRGLLIINGGGAGALLAFLGAIWSSATGAALAKPTLGALWILGLGALSAATFHLFRYQASFWYQVPGGRTKGQRYRSLYLGSAVLSRACFFAGVSILAVFAWRALGAR